jgi:hypothetical protein
MWWDPNIHAKHTNNKIRVVKGLPMQQPFLV